jgi:putative SOS response-associated peptidase YedK
MEAHPVSSRVGNVQNDDPELIEPVAMPVFRQVV